MVSTDRLARGGVSSPAETTLILITHKTSMLDVASRVIVVEQGKIVADGPKEAVLQQLKEGKVRVQETANG